MNKQFYRTIFNKHLGRLVVVSEKAHSQGKSDSPSMGGSTPSTASSFGSGSGFGLKNLSLSLLLSLGLAAHANTPTTIIADHSADKALQPIILNTASGVVSVNIATPNDKGLSNNHYSQFDVGNTGAVLNNNRQAVNTQIAGFVAANPFMARGEASTILNQINSNHPSHLGGFVEVAGKKADVIIANPSGLVVNGAGFINAGNVHLAAANSQVHQGQLTGYEVGVGNIAVNGKLNLQNTDYTALIAKTAQINDEIYAGNQLDVILGENQISLQDGDFTKLNATNKQTSASSASQTTNKEQQGVALDISSLGGMYAGKIHLVGTDKGFGVNNVGVITATGKGVQVGTGTLTLDAQGNLINTGILSAKDKLAVNTHNHSVQNDGTLLSEQADLTINTKDLESAGTIHSTQTTQIDAANTLNNQGNLYGGVLQITTNTLTNTGKLVQTGTGSLNIGTDTLTNSNKAVIGQSLYEQTTLDIPSTPSSAQSAGTIGSDSKGNTTANTGNSSNTGTPATKDTTKSIPVPSADGFITANQSLTNTNDQALITATGDISITANQTTNINQASIDAQTLNTNTLANTDSKITLDDINWQLTSFDNSKGDISAKDGMVIESESTIINAEGSLTSGGDMTLIAKDTIINQGGSITAAKQTDITAKELQNGGSITADTLIITQEADYTHTDDDKLIANNLTLTTDGKLVNLSQLTANHDLMLNASHIDNVQTGSMTSGHLTQITSQTDITNQGLINGETTVIKAKDTINNQSGGRIYGTHLAITADTLNNTPAKASDTDSHHTAPVIAARERLDIGVKNLNNNPNPDRAGKFNKNFDDQALITSLGSLHIGGSLDDNHQAAGKAQTVVNKGATIESGEQMQINTSVLKNENADFKSKVEQQGDAVPATKYFVNNNTYDKKEGEVYIQEGGWDGHWLKTLVTPDGRFANYSSHEYIKTDYTTKTANSDPATIRSGGKLLFDFNQAFNIDSVVISGDTARLNQDPTHAQNYGFTNHASTGEDYHTQTNNNYFNHVTADRRRRDNRTSKRPYTYKNLVKSDNQPQKVLLNTYQLPILNATISTTPSSTSIDKPTTGNDVSTIIKDINDDNTINIPKSALYTINADNPNQPLIQTDPAFTDYKQWLGSDYMLKAIQSDPNHIHKRLSDGYGEQARIKDEYYLLTGRHINTDYSSNEEAFKQLMDNGITHAKQFGYTLGTALTPEQMANLTTDIVWLVKQSITYTTKDNNGNTITKTEDVLVPKLYLRPANVDTGTLSPDGRYSAVSARNIDMQLTGNLDNSGNIIAKDTATIDANNINNTAIIQGNFVAIKADNDITNHGTLHANSAMSLDAGNKLINQSQTTTQTNTQGRSSGSRTDISQIATISVGTGLKDKTDDNGNPLTTLSIQSGNHILNKAANIQNTGGSTHMTAENGIDITTITTSNHINAVADENNYFKYNQTMDVGSNITSLGNLTLATTGKDADINIKGSRLDSATGTTAIVATGDIDITEGRSVQSMDTASKFTDKGLLSKTTTQTTYQANSDTSIQSDIEGESVVMKAGGDMQIVATDVLADTDILLASGGNMTIASADNTQSSQSHTLTKKSGLFSTSQASITLGKQRTQNDNATKQITHTGSTIGALDGNITMISGNNLNITNSDVIAQSAKDSTNATPTQAGNIHIQATDVVIESQNNQSSNESHFYQKTTGLTASISSSVASDVQSIETLKDAINDTDSRKAQLMGGLAAVSKARTLAQNLQDGKLGSVRVQATIGSQSTKSDSHSYQETNDAANVHADGNLIFDVKGKGENSTLTVTGSNISVGKDLYNQVEGDVTYRAATQTSTSDSKNSSKGVGFGVYASGSLSTDGLSSNAAGFTANANRAKGSSQETTITHTNSQVTVKGTTHNDIGGNLTLDGANLDTTYLTGTVGGDLIVKSRQDSYQYTHDQKQAGGSLDVSFQGVPQSASINAGKTDIDASYKQVTQQSGITAKESTLSVQGQGKFTGGYLITDAGKNQTQFAQGIQTQDIENHLNYEGDAISVGVGIGADTSNPNGKAKPALQGLGYGTIDPVNKTSTTHSAITDQAGFSHINTENFNQQEVQNGLNQIITNDFDKEQALKGLNAQTVTTTEFGREMPKQIGDYAQTKELELLAQGNIEEAKKWAEGGKYRVALHTAIGALGTGSLEGTLTTAGVAAAAPQIEKLEAVLTEKLANDDTEQEQKKANQIAKSIIATTLLTLGEASGLDASSTMMATNVEVNNRWLHDNEIEKIFGKDGAKLKQFAKEQGITYEEAWRAVLAQAYRDADDNFRKTHQSSAESKLSKAAQDFLRKNDLYIKTTAQERANSQQNINTTKYKPLLNSVVNHTPKQTQQQVHQTVLTQTAKTSAVGAAKGIGNIPSDTANGVANIFHREVKPTFPYSNEEEANVASVTQNVVGVATIGLTPKLPNTRVVNTYGPMNQQGPLPLSVANTFRSGTYVEIVTNKPLTLYRVYGGNASKLGSYWTTTKPSGPVQSIIDSALNPAWGNPATNVVKIEVPPNTRLYQGFAASQEGLVGGGVQVVFPKDVEIKTDWIKE